MLSSICKTEQRQSTRCPGQSKDTQQAIKDRAKTLNRLSRTGQNHQLAVQDRAETIKRFCGVIFIAFSALTKKYRIVHLVILKNILLCTHILVKVKNRQNSLLINQNTICLDICMYVTHTAR